MLNEEHLVQALIAAGVRGRNIVYVSVPITSGQREVQLMRKLGVRSSAELRTTEPELWQREVLDANELDALANVALVRDAPWLPPGFIVVDPSRMSVKGWDQDDYNRFWVRLMSEHVRFLVATPGWEYSRGARTEIGYALTFAVEDLEVVDQAGQAIDGGALRTLAEVARSALADSGWNPDEVDAYLPPLAETKPDLSPSAQSQTFNWLIAERRFQVRQFGSEQDDRRLIEGGLDPSAWWSTRLDTYLDRARAADLSDEPTRVELAKFVATAVALLESAIRVYGPVPRPGPPKAE
jgi:hypothetical protein